MPKSHRHVLLLEDNSELRSIFVSVFASRPELLVQSEGDRSTAEAYVRRRFVDVVILDLGAACDLRLRLNLIRQWRTQGHRFPIIVTASFAYDGLAAEVVELGADDFLRKPYLFDEMRARVLRHLARSLNAPPNSRRHIDGIEIPSERFKFAGATISPELLISFPNGYECRLSAKQMGIIVELSKHTGKLLLKADLVRRVWGNDGNPNSNSVNQYLYVLRRIFRSGGSDLDKVIMPENKAGWRVGNGPL